MVLRFLDFYDSLKTFVLKIWTKWLGQELDPDVADALDKVDDVNEFSRGTIWAFFMGE